MITGGPPHRSGDTADRIEKTPQLVAAARGAA